MPGRTIAVIGSIAGSAALSSYVCDCWGFKGGKKTGAVAIATLSAMVFSALLLGKLSHLKETSSVVQVSDSTFKEITREGVTVVDYYASWCGPCKRLSPILERVAKDLKGKVLFAKLNIDKNPITVNAFNIRSYPTLILFREGREVNRLVGLCDAAAIKRFALSWQGATP